MERLKKAILAGRFAWEKYVSGGTWYGMSIQTMPLFCSYGQIGFQVWSPFGESFSGNISWDWERNKIKED